MSIVELILGRVPASWPDFFAACDGRVYGQETKHNSERAESILKLMDSGLKPSDMTATLKNAHRDPVSIPICCLATRLGDPIVVEAVLSKLPKEEKLRGLLQDVADDHCCGVESFASSLETTDLGVDERAFAVVSAVERKSSRCLPVALRWAHGIRALSILCSSPDYFDEAVWHIPVMENAILSAIGDADLLAILLRAPLPNYPLSANQKARVMRNIMEAGDETSLNDFLLRFPEATRKVNELRFPESAEYAGAESLRRRCMYRLLFEPVQSHPPTAE